MSVERQLAEALRAFVRAEEEWAAQKAGMPAGTFDDPLDDAYKKARAALAAYEAGKGEEPDGEVVAGTGTLNDFVVIKWISDYHPKVGDKIYTSPIAADGVSVPKAVVEFLNGSKALDGKWFGERQPGKGQYWWREYLPNTTSLAAAEKGAEPAD